MTGEYPSNNLNGAVELRVDLQVAANLIPDADGVRDINETGVDITADQICRDLRNRKDCLQPALHSGFEPAPLKKLPWQRRHK